MKNINELTFGKMDAYAYQTPEEKSFFGKLFIADEHLNSLCNGSKYFLIGDKGTGKTAYAKYISDFGYNGYHGRLVQMLNTDYQRFVSIKNEKKITISDYSDVWTVIITFQQPERTKKL